MPHIERVDDLAHEPAAQIPGVDGDTGDPTRDRVAVRASCEQIARSSCGGFRRRVKLVPRPAPEADS